METIRICRGIESHPLRGRKELAMPKVAISAEFLVAFAQVPRRVQKKVRQFTEKFLHDPTQSSINYESIHGMKDPKVRTVRIGLDYRAIVLHPPRGDVYVCVWVDHHDEAMAWARNKRFEVHPDHGSFQIYEVQEEHETVPADPAIRGGDPLPPEMLLAERSRDDLRRCGVPELLVPSVCALRTEADLEALKHYLPGGVADSLSMLAAGYQVEEAARESQAAHRVDGGVDPDDFEISMSHPETRRRFRVLEKPQDLDAMLQAPLEATRTYHRGRSDAVFHDEAVSPDGFPVEVEVDEVLLERQLGPGERWVFGRAVTSDVILDSDHVSRQQFEVRNLGAQLEIKPFPSKNQVLILGRRAHGEVYFTTPRVQVRCGKTQVTLRRANLPGL